MTHEVMFFSPVFVVEVRYMLSISFTFLLMQLWIAVDVWDCVPAMTAATYDV